MVCAQVSWKCKYKLTSLLNIFSVFISKKISIVHWNFQFENKFEGLQKNLFVNPVQADLIQADLFAINFDLEIFLLTFEFFVVPNFKLFKAKYTV